MIAIDQGRPPARSSASRSKDRSTSRASSWISSGTVVPLYAINRVLGKIPLVGPFLSGREGEGAFAVTYSVKGAMAEPSIWVNPLSVLAPASSATCSAA